MRLLCTILFMLLGGIRIVSMIHHRRPGLYTYTTDSAQHLTLPNLDRKQMVHNLDYSMLNASIYLVLSYECTTYYVSIL